MYDTNWWPKRTSAEPRFKYAMEEKAFHTVLGKEKHSGIGRLGGNFIETHSENNFVAIDVMQIDLTKEATRLHELVRHAVRVQKLQSTGLYGEGS